MPARAVSFVNARVVADGETVPSIRFAGRVLSLGAPPSRHDVVVDLGGAFVLPGLVNAHDHLELDHYGAVKVRDRYANASEWIEDLRPRLASDAALRRGRAHPLADRLLIGGVKNLLSGATTVAHHNPRYREIGRSFPVHVVRRYGWAHSFGLEGGVAGANGEAAGEVARRFRETPATAPFIVHLAEGTDEAARGELERLAAAGCLRPNTVLVHSVGIAIEQWGRVLASGAGLVWCPASNLFLLGATVPVRELLDAHPEAGERIALGTDSRLTGSRDLLAEIRIACTAGRVTPCETFRMVTWAAARLLRLPHAGRLAVGAPADLLVLPRGADDHGGALARADRADVRLVAVGGRPLVGEPDLAAIFAARGVSVAPVRVDGVPKLLARPLARRLAACAIGEPGLELTA